MTRGLSAPGTMLSPRGTAGPAPRHVPWGCTHGAGKARAPRGRARGQPRRLSLQGRAPQVTRGSGAGGWRALTCHHELHGGADLALRAVGGDAGVVPRVAPAHLVEGQDAGVVADVGGQAAPVCGTARTGMWRPRRAASLLQVALLAPAGGSDRAVPAPTAAVRWELPGAIGDHQSPPSPVLVHWMVGFSRPVAEQDTVTSLLNSMHCSGWGGGVNFSFSARETGAPLGHRGVRGGHRSPSRMAKELPARGGSGGFGRTPT